MSKFNEKLVVNNIRSLGIDMIHEATSGHPGIVAEVLLRILSEV